MLQNWKNAVGRISERATTRGRVDETFIKIKKVWIYLYRAVDSQRNTLEFLLSPTRDAEAAKRFFLKALHSTADSAWCCSHSIYNIRPLSAS
jgi:transposase-like protein